MFIVYQLKNKVNGKCYVGITQRTLQARLAQHERTARSEKPSFVKHYLHHAIKKHGWNNFESSLLESNIPTKEQALERERYYVKLFNTQEEGYNLTPGGDHYTDSDWQRENQLKRVAKGNHPFVGGKIQSETAKKLWQEGKHNFIGLNQKRIADGTHNLLGDKNPTKRLAKLGAHHNQAAPWLNTKIQANNNAIQVWVMADKLYDWFLINQNKQRGGSYRAMEKAFNFKSGCQVILKKFKSGWNPTEDPKWLAWKASL